MKPTQDERYIRQRCATDPAFKEAYDARKLKEHLLEGSVLIIYTWHGVIYPPHEVDSIDEAREWCQTKKWPKGDEARFAQYQSGIWIVVQVFGNKECGDAR